MRRHPTLKWAQRADLLFITIDLPDAQDVNLKLEPEGKFYFSATSGADKIPYEIDIHLYDKVDVNESKASIGSRNVVYLVKKEESKWWSRLLKQDGKPPVFVKVDWDKWVDEDEEDGADMDFGGMDFSNLNMGDDGESDADSLDEGEIDSEDEVKEEEASTKEAAAAPSISSEAMVDGEVKAKA